MLSLAPQLQWLQKLASKTNITNDNSCQIRNCGYWHRALGVKQMIQQTILPDQLADQERMSFNG